MGPGRAEGAPAGVVGVTGCDGCNGARRGCGGDSGVREGWDSGVLEGERDAGGIAGEAGGGGTRVCPSV